MLEYYHSKGRHNWFLWFLKEKNVSFLWILTLKMPVTPRGVKSCFCYSTFAVILTLHVTSHKKHFQFFAPILFFVLQSQNVYFGSTYIFFFKKTKLKLPKCLGHFFMVHITKQVKKFFFLWYQKTFQTLFHNQNEYFDGKKNFFLWPCKVPGEIRVQRVSRGLQSQECWVL